MVGYIPAPRVHCVVHVAAEAEGVEGAEGTGGAVGAEGAEGTLADETLSESSSDEGCSSSDEVDEEALLGAASVHLAVRSTWDQLEVAAPPNPLRRR